MRSERGVDRGRFFFLQRLYVSPRFCFDVVHHIPPRVYCRSGDFRRASQPSLQHWPGVWEDLFSLVLFLALQRNLDLHERLDAKISAIWVLPFYMCHFSVFPYLFFSLQGSWVDFY
jgi:hypothetical protein